MCDTRALDDISFKVLFFCFFNCPSPSLASSAIHTIFHLVSLWFVGVVCLIWVFFSNIDIPALNRGPFVMLLVFVFSFSVINLMPEVRRFEFLYFFAHLSLILLVGR